MNDSIFFIIAVLWAVPWKGVALWKAARHNQFIWFVAILLFQTLGILEMIYLFFFQKDKN